MILPANSSPADNELSTLDPFSRFNMPESIKNIIVLFLTIEDILKSRILEMNNSSIDIYSLLHEPDQNQLYFRFTTDMERVWTRPHMFELGIKWNNCNQIIAKLGKLQRQASRLSTVVTTMESGLKASTRDYGQDIDCTVDWKRQTFWSSDGSPDQNKVDWLLYDLGTVAVITRISIAAFRAHSQINNPIYGFQKCCFELGFNSEQFHCKSKVFRCSNTVELQNFDMHRRIANILPAARYIKFWMQGCYQKQRTDNKWYFAVNKFEVRGIPLECFPDPVPKTLEVLGNLKSKRKRWFTVNEEYKEFVKSVANSVEASILI